MERENIFDELYRFKEFIDDILMLSDMTWLYILEKNDVEADIYDVDIDKERLFKHIDIFDIESGYNLSKTLPINDLSEFNREIKLGNYAGINGFEYLESNVKYDYTNIIRQKYVDNTFENNILNENYSEIFGYKSNYKKYKKYENDSFKNDIYTKGNYKKYNRTPFENKLNKNSYKKYNQIAPNKERSYKKYSSTTFESLINEVIYNNEEEQIYIYNDILKYLMDLVENRSLSDLFMNETNSTDIIFGTNKTNSEVIKYDYIDKYKYLYELADIEESGDKDILDIFIKNDKKVFSDLSREYNSLSFLEKTVFNDYNLLNYYDRFNKYIKYDFNDNFSNKNIFMNDFYMDRNNVLVYRNYDKKYENTKNDILKNMYSFNEKYNIRNFLENSSETYNKYENKEILNKPNLTFSEHSKIYNNIDEDSIINSIAEKIIEYAESGAEGVHI